MDTQQHKLLRVLVIGESCTDLYRFGKCERLSAEAPVPILLQTKTESKPGMAANVALNIESLGHEAIQVSNTTKIVKERFICATVADVSQQILRVDSSDTCPKLQMRTIENILDSDAIFDATIISDYNKGFLPTEVLAKIIPQLPKPVFVDSKKTDLSVFENCIIKINKPESDSADTVPNNCELITTLGEKGAKWRDKTYSSKKVQDVFDVCGAGDSFLAALAIKFIETQDMDKSIKFANLCAGISVRHLGVYNVSLSDVAKSVRGEK